ncbi:unnamed protein product [Scytosiphon promiscuus]
MVVQATHLAQTFLVLSAVWVAEGSSFPCPPIGTVEDTLLTTAKDDFGGNGKGLQAAADWSEARLRSRQSDAAAPYLCCTEYDRGHEAYSRLQSLLSPAAVRPVSSSLENGACYFATASQAQAAAILKDDRQFGLTSFSPFPAALKIAPGLLEHDANGPGTKDDRNHPPGRLRAQHGKSMRMGHVEGLSLELAPGVLPARSSEGGPFISDLLGDLMSESVDLHSTNFWSDPAVVEDEHLATPQGAVRGQNWGRAAAVVHELSEAAGTVPGDICSWDSITVHHTGDDVLFVSGLDHLLYSGRGAGGSSEGGEAAELHVACFMGLVSFFAGRPEVLRIAARYRQGLLNASARANIQTATLTDTPFTDAGLDGTGQVIQVIDSGLDETSCFFANDESGEEVMHGHYFEEWGITVDLDAYAYISSDDSSRWSGMSAADHTGRSSGSSSYYSSSYQIEEVFTGGNFTVYTDRRKIIQYINLIKSDDVAGSHGDSFTTSLGEQFSWLPADEFEFDDPAGHGTHTAGSAAGATLNSPAEPITCGAAETLSCVGACVDDNPSVADDDLVSYYQQYADIDRLCPLFSDFGCDDAEGAGCLSDDVSENLTNNGGMAQGAKLAIFDAFYGMLGLAGFVGNGLWEPCREAGCKIHTNSWGGDYYCALGPQDVLYDTFMYQNPENLLIFAAGNEGEYDRTSCTISSPAIAKNVLAVGATVSGETRFSVTASVYPETPNLSMDTVAYFSSYGPTLDGRIKPEVLAPGDMVYSAGGDGTDAHSCRLWAYAGTSMSCPIVAGASAMIRQYFMNETFYAADMTARGFCDDWFGCEAFSPSAATIKALLINSANLMGGSSEPDGYRGFGRIHMEEGMPLAGENDLVLFVADANYTSTPELTREEYNFDVDADAGRDFRVTLSWIDPPASTFSSKQLVHDLDLAVISPSGTRYTMWTSGATDTSNVNERVIVDAADVESGTYSVWVWAKMLSTDVQSYSLVVNGAISPGTGVGAIERSSSTSSEFYGFEDPSEDLDVESSSQIATPTAWGVCISVMFGVVVPCVVLAFAA